MKYYFDHYGEKEDNFAQITIVDEYDEKIDVINIESIDEENFKKLFSNLTTKEDQEFIYEGGVNMKDKKYVTEELVFEPIRVDFKIVSNRNPEVYTEGYVEINDEIAEDVDWYYYDAQGMPTPQMFIEHDGVDGFRGATDEQKWEVEQFRGDYGEDAFWIDTCILQSNDDENRTHVRENLTLIINEGAKAELEIFPSTDEDYWATLRFSFNGEHITMDKLSDVCDELCEDIDSLYADDGRYFVDGDIEREISKYYWSDNPAEKEISMSIEQEILDGFQLAFARQLVLDAEIGDKYGDVLEQCLDGETDDEWLFKFSTAIKNDSVRELIDSEGYEYPSE